MPNDNADVITYTHTHKKNIDTLSVVSEFRVQSLGRLYGHVFRLRRRLAHIYAVPASTTTTSGYVNGSEWSQGAADALRKTLSISTAAGLGIPEHDPIKCAFSWVDLAPSNNGFSGPENPH